ncbi:uncharacterized protein LOC117581131 [Drosophila guanche]|uniref:Uncharacterized protein n=1 Tax=Drosophila guanche TaxID=7266 RepID=A0A3B0JRY4_DROGU|nr:uncharacterized protein LOC117581131 [Drosophila guanche]SPP78240.1 Hypothetical predicted protein [Drosophila guanche]
MNPDKMPVPDDKQDESNEQQQQQGSTAAEVNTPPPMEDLAVLAPIERNYFMRINRQEQATSVSVRQPENWRARPQESAKKSGKARGSAVQAGAAAATSSAPSTSTAAASTSVAASASAESITDAAAPSNGFAADALLDGNVSSSDDDDFSDFCEYDTMFQEQPNYDLVRTWSSYVKRRYAAAGGQRAPLEMGRPAATSDMPPIENWRARAATASTEAASTSSWRHNLDFTRQRRSSRSGNHNPEASGSQEELQPERQPARRPTHNTRGHHGRQRNQWTNSAYHNPPTLNGAVRPNANANANANAEHPGITNGFIGAPGVRDYQQESFRGFSMIGGFQRTRSFGPSNNRRAPPSADANPGRRVSM